MIVCYCVKKKTLFYSHDVTTLEEHDDSMFKQERSPFVHLGYALWYVVLSHTDIVCYIMVFINQVNTRLMSSFSMAELNILSQSKSLHFLWRLFHWTSLIKTQVGEFSRSFISQIEWKESPADSNSNSCNKICEI